MTEKKEPFRLWAVCCAHVGTDLRRDGRESLADAIRHSEFGNEDPPAPPFAWDIAVNLGDTSGSMCIPDDAEGAEVRRQYATSQKHRREDFYDICGNHDRNATWEPETEWFQKWVDPLGVNTEFSGVDPAKRPYPVRGTWERYELRVGNLLFLLMSDRNEPTQAVGRGVLGGNPGGVVTGETFRWWQRRVEANPDALILSAHHYLLKNTTVATGPWEGVKMDGRLSGGGVADTEGAMAAADRYHGALRMGTPQGASYLYWQDSIRDGGLFEQYLESHPGATDFWLGGHTHTHPDDTYGGKSHIETKWGVHFANVCALSRYHGSLNVPMSRLFTFTPGSDEVVIDCYMHTDQYKPLGWYDDARRVLKLSRPFSW